jgi:hypothetical protein
MKWDYVKFEERSRNKNKYIKEASKNSKVFLIFKAKLKKSLSLKYFVVADVVDDGNAIN